MRNRLLLAVAGTIVGVIVVLAAAGLFVVYSGTYNVAATEEHASMVRWALDTTFHRSIRRHATGLAAPEPISAETIDAGAGLYKSACQHCHGGPGVERARWAAGMRPQPPHLTEAAGEWRIEEVYWLVRHGAKMTGMPAFGPSHDDATLWGVAAFVGRLPAMTPERYAASGGAGHHGAAGIGAHGGRGE